MKFLVLVKASAESEAGTPPTPELLSEMMKFNEELMKAGVLLDLGGLQPSSQAVRIKIDGKSRKVVDGPFSETKELVAGYWLIQVKSREEAIEWIKRCPNPTNAQGEIEIRPLFEMTDFPHATTDTVERAAKIDQQIKR
ncbi:MAG TPA: YciI family protein [Kofleriaceae bacterium]|nr:YciI family protein [Kofleriaceae bacterium]